MLNGFNRRRSLVATLVAVVAGLVVVALLVTTPSSSRVRTSTGGAGTRGALVHALATETGSSPAAAAAALHRLTASRPAADQPSCATSTDPSFKTPAAQFPDGQHGLGVPFVASLTAGELLSGYHTGAPVVQPGYKSKWGLSLTDISGWVTGLLEVPSLTTLVDKTTGIMFCDDRHYVPNGKTSEVPPRIKFDLRYGNTVANNQENFSLNPAEGGYTPWFFSVVPDAAPILNVADVESSGAIDLRGSTAASANVAVWEKKGSAYKYQYTCVQGPGTVIAISTKSSAVPADGAPGATNQFTPSALHGGFPSATNLTPASATLVGNDFPVSAYPFPSAKCGVAITFDGSLSGYAKSGLVRYLPECKPSGGSLACPAIASPPGWSQITIKATITTLDIPYGTTGLGS